MYPEALSNRQCTNKSHEGSRYIYIYINSYSLNYTFQSLWFMDLNSTAMPKSRSIRRLQTHSPSCCLKAWAHGQWVASAISSDSSEASTFQKDSCSVETWQRFPLDVETVDINIARLCCISLKSACLASRIKRKPNLQNSSQVQVPKTHGSAVSLCPRSFFSLLQKSTSKLINQLQSPLNALHNVNVVM